MGAFMYSDVKNTLEKTVITFTRVLEEDDNGSTPESQDEGFWPSLDKNAAGYIGENPEKSYDEQMEYCHKRLRDFDNGVWNYCGVRAKATIKVPCGSGSICTYTLKSPGIWGIESDSDESYLNEVFEGQKEELLSHIKAMANCEVK